MKYEVTPNIVERAEINIRKRYRISDPFAQDRREFAAEYAKMLATELETRETEGNKLTKKDNAKDIVVWWEKTCFEANANSGPRQDKITDQMRDLVSLSFRVAVGVANLKPIEDLALKPRWLTNIASKCRRESYRGGRSSFIAAGELD